MKQILYFVILCFLPVWTGCSPLSMSPLPGDFLGEFQYAVMSHPDPETVKAGLPAYLLLIDGIIRSEPENQDMIRQAALLYSAYAGIFIEDPERAGELNQLAFGYAQRAMCLRHPETCGWREMSYDDFEKLLDGMKKKDVPAIYTLGVTWAGWIRTHADSDLEAIAEIARVEALLKKVVQFDESYQNGGAHLYLGMLNTILTPALGGNPQLANAHFQKALEMSRPNLMVKVLYAQQYARQIFDRELYERVLNEVLDSGVDSEENRLMNRLAKIQARSLLDQADEFF